MIKTFKLGMVGLMLLIFQSFTVSTAHTFTGVYGVSANDPSGIQLQLNEDHTFTFTDFSNPKNKINASGTWVIKNGFVVLTSSDYEGAFHNKWKFTQNCELAKSRKGMTFYTLCKKK